MMSRRLLFAGVVAAFCIVCAGCPPMVKSSDNAILTFRLPSPKADGVIDDAAHTVTVSVPAATAITSLKPEITVSDGASVSPASGEAQDFSQPVTYTVTSESGVEQAWVATVVPGARTGRDIVSFSFASPAAAGTVSSAGHTVGVAVPPDTTLASLSPTIVVSPGATVSPASGAARDFSKPVTYTVTAESGDKQAWVVTVALNLRGGLLGEWLMDGNANDTSGSGHNGTPSGSVSAADDRFGAAASACAFGGGMYDCGSPADNSFDLQGDAAINAWVKLSSVAETYIISKDNGGYANNKWFFGCTADGRLLFHINTESDSDVWLYSTTPAAAPTAGQWYQFSVTKHGTAYSFFIDGQPMGTATSTIEIPSPIIAGLHIGEAEGITFAGSIDDVRIWNRTLTAKAIQELYQEGVSVPRTGLKGEWLFSGNAKDTSGSGHNGTVGTGATLTADRFGASSKAYLFDATAEAQITAAGVGVDTSAGALNTVSLWFKRVGATDSIMPFAWDEDYDIWLSGGSIGFNTGNSELTGTTRATSTGQWFHVVAVFYNGVPDAVNNALYINGVKQSLGLILAGDGPQARSATSSIWISGWSEAEVHTFDGVVDDVRVYDRALTQAEVEELYLTGN
jgi:hypothetical protein